MRAKFSDIETTGAQPGSACCAKGTGACNENPTWITPEHIPVKGAYTAADLEHMEHLG